MPSVDDDDDENFETIIGHDGKPTQILRNGGRIRVKMTASDAARLQRAVADAHALHDGHGRPVGFKPGFVVSNASQTIRDRAYRESVLELTTAWQRPTGDVAPGAEPAPISAADAVRTDLTTLMARLNDARRSAYESYVHELTNAWRRTG
jgi:hypothetical protein